ncbi:MAG: hypothetical protein P4L33_16280 [Capsulimonadaceae bacterium]|nr:hypothetical protein [Capsulimonadaceae bacterium]
MRTATKQGARFFIIDATDAAYVDTPGVRWLLRLRALIENMGKGLRIVTHSKSPVTRNLQMLQVDIDRYETLATAWRTPWTTASNDRSLRRRAARNRAA